MTNRRKFSPTPADGPHYFGTGNYNAGGTGFGSGGFGDPGEAEERRVGEEPPFAQRSDAHIQQELEERLLHSDRIDSSQVKVAVEGGRVTFDGTVPDLAMKHHIEDLADHCPGVEDIQNRVRVLEPGTPDPQSRGP